MLEAGNGKRRTAGNEQWAKRERPRLTARDPQIAARSGRLRFYLIAAAVLAVDQATKLAAAYWLQPHPSIPLLGRFVSLSYRTNTGAAFGLVPWASTALQVLAAAVVAILLVYGWRMAQGSLALDVALACLLGGAAGNLLDRLRLGYVVDFIDLHFWPVFNIADTAITVGAILFVGVLLISDFRHRTSDTGHRTNDKPPSP